MDDITDNSDTQDSSSSVWDYLTTLGSTAATVYAATQAPTTQATVSSTPLGGVKPPAKAPTNLAQSTGLPTWGIVAIAAAVIGALAWVLTRGR